MFDSSERRIIRREVGKIESILRPFMFASSQSQVNGNIHALEYKGPLTGKSLKFNFLDRLSKRFNDYAKAHNAALQEDPNSTNLPNPAEQLTLASFLSELQRLVDIPYASESDNILFVSKNALSEFRPKLRRNTKEFKTLQAKQLDRFAIGPFFEAKHDTLTEEDLNFLLSEFDRADIEYRLRAAVVGLSGKNWKKADLSPEETAVINEFKDDYPADQSEKFIEAVRFALKKHKYMASQDYQANNHIPRKHRSALFVHDMADISHKFTGLTSKEVRQVQDSYLKIVETMGTGAEYLLDDLDHLSPPQAA